MRGVVDEAGALPRRKGYAWLWVGYHDARVSAEALALALQAVSTAAAADSKLPDAALSAAVAALLARCRRAHPDYVARILILAARARGIPYRPLPERPRHWQFGWGQRSRIFFEAAPMAESVDGWNISRDKALTNRVLRQLGLPVTEQRLADTLDAARRHAAELGWPLVVKPADRGQGKGVSVGIDSMQRLEEAFAHARRFSSAALVLKTFVEGLDHRLLVVRGRLVAATRREPPTLLGDGVHSVRQLIEQLNRQRAADPVTARYLKPVAADDAVVLAQLARLDLQPASVPAAGRVLPPCGNANVSTGGTPSNVLDQVHPEVRALAESIALNTGLQAVGIDYLAPTVARPWREAGGRVIEINKTPGLDLHLADGGHEEEALGALILGGARRRLAGPPPGHGGTDRRQRGRDPAAGLPGRPLRAAGPAGRRRRARSRRRAGGRVRLCRPGAVLARNRHGAERRRRDPGRPGGCANARAHPAGPPRCTPRPLRAAHAQARTSAHKRAHAGDGPVLFTMMRNERHLAPFFFDHYRALGVQTFLVYDDHSDDGSTDFLLAQDDCTVLGADAGFNERMPSGQAFQHHLRNAVPGGLETGRWVLSVDADEFLLLPPGMAQLAELYAWLDRRQDHCVLASMVDFYPRRLRDRHADPERSPFDRCPWFDADRGFVRQPDGRIDKTAGGVRWRLQALLRERDPAAHAAIYKGRGYQMAALWKTPLVRTGAGVVRVSSHSVNVTPPPDVELALAHFKFGPDLDGRIADALARRNYYLGSIEYRFLDAVLRRFEDEDLLCARSRRYQGAASLAEAGFIVMPDRS